MQTRERATFASEQEDQVVAGAAQDDVAPKVDRVVRRAAQAHHGSYRLTLGRRERGRDLGVDSLEVIIQQGIFVVRGTVSPGGGGCLAEGAEFAAHGRAGGGGAAPYLLVGGFTPHGTTPGAWAGAAGKSGLART